MEKRLETIEDTPQKVIENPLNHLFSKRTPWNFRVLWSVFIISFILQVALIQSLTDYKSIAENHIASLFQLGFYLLVLIRILIAHVSRQTGPGWMLYLPFLLTSDTWIHILVNTLAPMF